MTIPLSDGANAAGSKVSRLGGAYASLTGPVWAGDYVYRASGWVDGCSGEIGLSPRGVVARWEFEAGVSRLLVPDQVVCPPGFVRDSARGAWVRDLPAKSDVYGFEARARAVANGVGVEVLEVWGERARVRETGRDDSGQWVGLGELGRVVVDQTALLSWSYLLKDRFYRETEGPNYTRFRRVFPVGFDAWSSPERVGGVGVEVWSSHWASPVPASGTSFIVVGGVPFPRAHVNPRDPHPEGPASYVALDSWCTVPAGVDTALPWRDRLLGRQVVDRDAEGFVGVGPVRARWGGRAVEVVYVAYCYAYVSRWGRSEPRSTPLRPRFPDELEVMEGPVRLDELEDVRFDVYVRRHPEAGSWSFLNVWGLPGDLEGSAEARLERGCWPAWPVTHQLGPVLT